MVFGVAAQQLRSPRGRGAPSAHQLAQLGLICLAWAIVGALWLVFDFDAGSPASMIVLGLAVVFLRHAVVGCATRREQGQSGRQGRSVMMFAEHQSRPHSRRSRFVLPRTGLAQRLAYSDRQWVQDTYVDDPKTDSKIDGGRPSASASPECFDEATRTTDVLAETSNPAGLQPISIPSAW